MWKSVLISVDETPDFLINVFIRNVFLGIDIL
jgi:hypothetical protein